MKRIILGISVLLMLVQNGFAETDAEWDRTIANESDPIYKQTYRCAKSATNHPKTANIDICLKVMKAEEQTSKYSHYRGDLPYVYVNVAILYASQGQPSKAYKYFKKAEKLGNPHATNGLNILCRKSPWACK